MFTSDLKEDDPFFFNLNFNEHGELILGEGTNQAHLNLIMASKYSLSMLSKGGTGHTDATYKITTTGFNLIIFGVTDIRGHFHPASFMISSHETEDDFKHLYEGIKKQCAKLDIDYSPTYLMQDACYASFNAVRSVYPDAVVLMCYFLVKTNIRKNLFSILGNL